MRIKFDVIITVACILMLAACSGNSTDSKTSADVKEIADSNKSAEDALRKQIVGTWTSFETVRGETIVFDENGKYSGYDGREEYEGTWEFKNHKLHLSLGGLFTFKIMADTLYLDSTKYMRQPPELTDGNK
jgi:hypothetical protein